MFLVKKKNKGSVAEILCNKAYVAEIFSDIGYDAEFFHHYFWNMSVVAETKLQHRQCCKNIFHFFRLYFFRNMNIVAEDNFITHMMLPKKRSG